MKEVDIGEIIKEFITANGDILQNNRELKKYLEIYSVRKSFETEKNLDKYIYNEYSFQHELGIYLRKRLEDKYIVKFEQNIKLDDKSIEKSFVKKEIDIVIINKKNREKYAIELKYPNNGRYPEEMYDFCKDIKFMEQVKKDLGYKETYCVTITNDNKFYDNRNNFKKDGIYGYFRNRVPLKNTIIKPTGNKDNKIKLYGEYNINWKNISKSEGPNKGKYYVIKIKQDINTFEATADTKKKYLSF